MTTLEKFDNPLLENISLRLLARASPAWFAHISSQGFWKPAPHLLLLEDYLMKASQNKHRRIIVNMPPRHGKSEFISKYFPAWYLGRFPDKRIIFTSYETTFAQSWGRKVLQILQEWGSKIFGISIDAKKAAAGDFAIAGRSGGMICTGAGGAITGRGADLLLIDDPVKNDAEANSITYRESVYEWFRSTAFTRLEPGGSVILLMTRWHEDDLAGRLLRDEPDKWENLILPALAEENDPLGRKLGESLWPERFDTAKLNELKNTLGQYWFSALYQQHPSITDGGVFKRSDIRYFDENENAYVLDNKQLVFKENARILATCDLAATISDRADFTAIVVAAISKDGEILILDVWREKIEGARHLELIRSLHQQYKPALIGIEAVQYQISLVQAAMTEGLPVKRLNPDKDKFSRALPMAAKMEAGKIFFRRNALWLHDFIDELLKFPNASHDDQVDAFAYLYSLHQPISGILPKGCSSGNRSKRFGDF